MDQLRQEAIEMLDGLVARTGLSLSQIATKAGLTPSTLTRFRNHPVKHQLSAPTIAKLRATFPEPGASPPPRLAAIEAAPRPPLLQKDLPVYGTALGADLEFTSLDGHPVAIEQTMLNQADVIDTIRRLPLIQDERDAYGLYTQGSSMAPAFEDGDPVVVAPKRPVRPGDYVVVHLVRPDGDEGEEAAAVLLKKLLRRSASYLELEQFNPPAQFKVDAARVKAVHKVPRLAELIGQ